MFMKLMDKKIFTNLHLKISSNLTYCKQFYVLLKDHVHKEVGALICLKPVAERHVRIDSFFSGILRLPFFSKIQNFKLS